MNWKVRVLQPCEVLDANLRAYVCEAIGRRVWMAPDKAMAAAAEGKVEILSPVGVKAYQEQKKTEQQTKAKRTYNRRDVQAGPLN
jgi:hypothetical protein